MKKFISGKILADTIEKDHLKRIGDLKKNGIIPRLAIIQTIDSPIIDTYVRVKKTYADKIGILVEHYHNTSGDSGAILDTVNRLNADDSTHGIIIQLPLHDSIDKESLINGVYPEKDVDGLCVGSLFTPPTARAIMTLLTAYGVLDETKKIALVGHGRLVGAPVSQELTKNNIPFKIFTENDSLDDLRFYNVVISATGIPSLIMSDYISPNSYVFDAGTAEDGLKIHGDVSDELYDRDDIFVTPKTGGIGILTVRMLFENLLQACEKKF